ncbi:MAG: hybrid sensor histidine kinase/response regulator [Deltaproteobacteria bacterium]|nr:hybrid sensor histidine kinase/response regulator [Deltaproteobacteria bacterium]
MSVFNKEKLKNKLAEPRGIKKYNILLVDDERANLTSISRLLGTQYNVLTAKDGQEALEMVADFKNKEDLHLIISDQRMPNLTGVDFFKRVQPIAPDTIRILLTGFSDIETIVEATNEGRIYKYMTKPIETNDLRVTVQRALEAYDLTSRNHNLIEELRLLNANLEEKVEERTEALEKSNRDLKELNREKNEFLGIASHDLRSPVSSIQGMADLILKEYADFTRDEILQFMGQIKDSSGRILRLITDFMDVSVIESRQGDIKLKPLDLGRALEEVLGDLKINAETKGIELKRTGETKSLRVLGDRDSIHQVLDNLISNAVKYTPPNKKVLLIVSRSDTHFQIQVKDEGPGIRPDEMDRLFGKFSRLSSKPTAGEPSTGLGLYIVKKIAESMGARVWCESDYGRGASFFIEFKAHPE